ncbi:hypothetical protein E1I69_17635 [Bacillus timonensis]|uniref:Uncharacterized protein n=1 Tax=Bacillus timonensis TaxID=1033734 RepID=A0A4S3PNP2_9BACI|nr:hypothetical protein [Bacillus timonensis]THE10766.1 hypothetical protein E1I69_17635 [Bacillus timonensis]
MGELIEGFLFYMVILSPAVVGIPLQVRATIMSQRLDKFFAINCILASGVQIIVIISYVFYVANQGGQQAEAVGWLLVAYVLFSIVIIGLNTLMVLVTHFITKWVLKLKANKTVKA